MVTFKRLIQKIKLKLKTRKLLAQVGKLDVRKQQLEKECRLYNTRIEDLRKEASDAQKQGRKGNLDDLLSAMKDYDLKQRNANFLLNNLDKKREKLMRAIEIYKTAIDDIFSGEDVDFNLVEDLDAQIAVDTEDLQREHRQISRLHSSLSDTRERLTDTERDNLLKRFELDSEIETVTEESEQRIKERNEVDEMRQAEEMEELLKSSLEKSPEDCGKENSKTDPLGSVSTNGNGGMKQS
jgi:hypothetical protein